MCNWRKGVITSVILSACILTGCAGRGEIENEAASLESSTEGKSIEEIQQDIIEKDSTQQADNNILEGQIADQSFQADLDGWGEVTFAAFEPLEYSSENPDYGTTMFGDVRFILLADGKEIYAFPGETEDNILTGFMQFKKVLSVAFRDYNADGRNDVLLLLEYVNADGENFRKARIYTQDVGGNEFHIEKELSEYLASYTEDMSQIYEGIDDYNLLGLDNMEGLSEEEQIALYNEKYDYYRKSAYYEEITAYWEGVREVTDVSNLELPLYETDKEYLIKEELADVPPVVIHLAKNEIYARHGYIFTDEDLYNYFMGCMWYEPVVAPEDFTDEVFNEYEKANLELLAELDTL